MQGRHSVYDDCTERTREQFGPCLMTTWVHLATTSVALNEQTRPRPNADMTDDVALCTVAFIRLSSSAISAIKLLRARCFSHYCAFIDIHALSRHTSRYSFIASFASRLVCGSILFAILSAVGIGVS